MIYGGCQLGFPLRTSNNLTEIAIGQGICVQCGKLTDHLVTNLSGQTLFWCYLHQLDFEEGCRMSNGFDRGYHEETQ